MLCSFKPLQASSQQVVACKSYWSPQPSEKRLLQMFRSITRKVKQSADVSAVQSKFLSRESLRVRPFSICTGQPVSEVGKFHFAAYATCRAKSLRGYGRRCKVGPDVDDKQINFSRYSAGQAIEGLALSDMAMHRFTLGVATYPLLHSSMQRHAQLLFCNIGMSQKV